MQQLSSTLVFKEFATAYCFTSKGVATLYFHGDPFGHMLTM